MGSLKESTSDTWLILTSRKSISPSPHHLMTSGALFCLFFFFFLQLWVWFAILNCLPGIIIKCHIILHTDSATQSLQDTSPTMNRADVAQLQALHVQFQITKNTRNRKKQAELRQIAWWSQGTKGNGHTQKEKEGQNKRLGTQQCWWYLCSA